MPEGATVPRVLVIEDEPALRRGLERALGEAGFRVDAVGDGREGYEAAKRGIHRLIVLDLALPGMDGLEVCRRLRREGVRVPIVVLTARGGEDDRVRGLDLGADDYVTKPFSVRELLARVRSVLRRTADVPAGRAELAIPGGVIDLARLEVRRGRAKTALSAREGAILDYLAAHSDRIVPRRELLLKVWGYPDADIDTRTVDAHMARLRRKVEADPGEPRVVLTVRGKGYRFVGANP